MSSDNKYKILVVESDGILGNMPAGGIINAGGTSSPTFSVGGRALLFADGTSTAPGGAVGFSSTLQDTYDNSDSGIAKIQLVSGKDFAIVTPTGSFRINSDTGAITTSGALDVTGLTTLSSLQVSGTINNIDIVTLAAELDGHISGNDPALRHIASDINILPVSGLPGVNNVQDAINNISEAVTTLVSKQSTFGYEHIQTNPSLFWQVTHGGNTKRIQISIYDSENEMVVPNIVKILDENNIAVTFTSPQAGTAIIIMF